MPRRALLPELNSPAGSMEALVAAVQNGCDAVYMGGKNFNARASADNFTDAELGYAIEYCRLRGVKAYVTLNTIYNDDELKPSLIFAARAFDLGADALITADIGLAAMIRENVGDARLHASTQATAGGIGPGGVKRLAEAGFSRVILNREASIEEIKDIAARAKGVIETEVFAHGALCVSYSGQCLMSSFIGGRSGNRGRCAQPCRLDFSIRGAKGKLLSPKDLSALSVLGELVSAGVDSLKIEGRMRSPAYAAVTTRVYREALDRAAAGENPFDEADYNKLLQIFNRGGSFTNGYFRSHSGKDMMSVGASKATGVKIGEVAYAGRSGAGETSCVIKASGPLRPGDGIEIVNAAGGVGTGINRFVAPNETFKVRLKGKANAGDPCYKTHDKQLSDEARNSYANDLRKLEVTGRAVYRIGEPAFFTLTANGVTAGVTGAVVERAEKSPLDMDELRARLSKSGDTTFRIVINDLQADEGVYANIKDVNALRRDALDSYKEKYIASFKRDTEASLVFKEDAGRPRAAVRPAKTLTASVTTKAQFKAALNAGIKIIYIDAPIGPGPGLELAARKPAGTERFADIGSYYGEAEKAGCRIFIPDTLSGARAHGRFVKTWDALADANGPARTDYRFNVFNSRAFYELKKYAESVALSPELTYAQLMRMDGAGAEIIVYGRVPLMITRQCPVGLYIADKGPGKGCQRSYDGERYSLIDRTGAEYPVVRDCASCEARIFNCDILDMRDRRETLRLPQEYFRLAFTVESESETADVVRTYQKFLNGAVFPKIGGTDATHGHFFRGVE